MFRLTRVIIFSLIIFCCGVESFGQGWTDPAINHSRLFREKLGEGVYKLVGTYKVKGSPYLYGDKHNGDIFSPVEKGFNIDVRYNTYNQEVEFTSTANRNTPLVKLPGEVDSFVIKKDLAFDILHDVKFIYGKHLNSGDKVYFQVVSTGPRFSLYKRYKSDLGYVSENYVQSELRQFDLVSDYFYSDATTKAFKKLKLNWSTIQKEFKGIKDISGVGSIDAFSINPESVLVELFEHLNK